MSELKTKPNDASAEDFINSVDDDVKREDSFKLLEMYKSTTGHAPKMWGTAIIGFDVYHYKSERSSQEGDWPLAAFSPRKQNLTLYIALGSGDYDGLLDRLGKYKTSGGCLYIKRLSDVDLDVLERLIEQSYLDAKAKLNP